jgi:hypothetical protein
MSSLTCFIAKSLIPCTASLKLPRLLASSWVIQKKAWEINQREGQRGQDMSFLVSHCLGSHNMQQNYVIPYTFRTPADDGSLLLTISEYFTVPVSPLRSAQM